jgi:hypothetical protein
VIENEPVVAVLLVDHPRNILESVPVPLVMFVVLFDDAPDAHVGNDTLEPVVQVIEPFVVDVYVVPALFLIVPVPPFLLNVNVFVVAVQLLPL